MIGDWTAWVFMSARAGGLDFFSLIILDQIQQFLMHAPQSLVLNYVRSTQEPTLSELFIRLISGMLLT